jgi:ethanolamine kinase
LCGNIILLPGSSAAEDGESQPSVRFIDYEYATPSPAAFDIANHFAEWGGFDCDYNAMPTQAQRRLFVLEYVRTYFGLLARSDGQRHVATAELETEATKLMAEIDEYRGIPGLYWGIWASIQAVISEIDFDYSSYADLRLAEYWAWRAQRDGSLSTKSCDMPLRESKWAQAE